MEHCINRGNLVLTYSPYIQHYWTYHTITLSHTLHLEQKCQLSSFPENADNAMKITLTQIQVIHLGQYQCFPLLI